MFNNIINIKFYCLYIFILILHFVPGLLHCVWFKVVIMKLFIVFCKELNHQDSTRSSSENRQISRLWKRFNDPHLSFVLAPSSGRKNYHGSKGGSQLMEHENSIGIKKHTTFIQLFVSRVKPELTVTFSWGEPNCGCTMTGPRFWFWFWFC